jgi:hypothetical protein
MPGCFRRTKRLDAVYRSLEIRLYIATTSPSHSAFHSDTQLTGIQIQHGPDYAQTQCNTRDDWFCFQIFRFSDLAPFHEVARLDLCLETSATPLDQPLSCQPHERVDTPAFNILHECIQPRGCLAGPNYFNVHGPYFRSYFAQDTLTSDCNHVDHDYCG